VEAIRHLCKCFSALTVLFVSSNETAQHLILRGRKWLTFRKDEQRRQIERDCDQLAHSSRAPRLIDNALACLAA
jgi:hypothetical protein